jgi:glycosyltransferase involved in cell wall biosynthesis
METMNAPTSLSIIIPAYHEEATIAEVLSTLAAVAYPVASVETIVVDDASTDATADRVRRWTEANPHFPVRLLVHERNRGKGAAFRTGLAAATGEIVVIQDADLEYKPSDIPALVAPILSGDADVVYGSRFLGGPHRVLYFWHYVGNSLLTLFSNAMTNINLTDMETGYKAFRADFLRGLKLTQDRFGIEPELTARVARAHGRIFEIPISYYGRTYAEGKKITWRDGFAAFWHIAKHNLFD